MKNIFILPTDKPSTLVQGKNLYFYKDGIEKDFIDKDEKLLNLYITSDEEIKEGERGISINNAVYTHYDYLGKTYGKKIILTTDPDLIADGVQSIDDEFLEWFVKNPNCEYAEVERIFLGNSFVHIGKTPSKKERLHGCYNNGKQIVGKWEELFTYKIIITQEESNRTHYLDELPNMDKKILAKMWEDAVPKLEPKRETLEEAAENNSVDEDSSHYSDKINREIKLVSISSFKSGAKWQQERSYSGEDMFDCWKASHTGGLDDKSLRAHFNHWFKKFKKK